MNFKLKNNIETYESVLSEEDRLTLFRTSIFLVQPSNDYPGLQTHSNFHLELKKLNQFFILEKIIKKANINKKIFKCWANYTDKETQYISWHRHDTIINSDRKYNIPSNRHIVYYIYNPEGKGTWFNTDDEITKLSANENSMVILPNHLLHSVPSDITKPRLSLAIDFMDN